MHHQDGESGGLVCVETLESTLLPTAYADAKKSAQTYGMGALVYVMRFNKETSKAWAPIAIFFRGKEVALKDYPYPG